jgi:hypothetical protein
MDVIQRQAGTLSKSILEGVMNSIDAGASRIAVSIDQREISVSDDGRGFRSRQEIEEFFETFGQPHDEAAERKRYGTFRMGRGQLFAFGANVWQSGGFRMDVDIQTSGLDYTLRSDVQPPFPGCLVQVRLYEPLSLTAQRDAIDDLRDSVKYIETPLTINGEPVGKKPADCKWDLEDEHAYYKFNAGEAKVYNLGVRVRGYGYHHFAIGGEFVSKQKLKVNFARNDIMSDCPVWKKMAEVIRERGDRDSYKKSSKLTDQQRRNLLRRLLIGDLDPKNVYEAALVTDVNGRQWSLENLYRQSGVRGHRLLFAQRGHRPSALAHDRKRALVLSVNALTDIHLDPADLARLLRNANYGGYRMTTAAELDLDCSDEYTLLAEKDWTKLEQAVLSSLGAALWAVRKEVGDEGEDGLRHCRKLLLGTGPALAWTDGATYIAFDRDYLRAQKPDLEGVTNLCAVLLHECAHDAPSTGRHEHSDEFYETFHEYAVRGALAKLIARVWAFLPTRLAAAGRRLTRKQLAIQDKLNQAEKSAGVLVEA